MPRAKGPWKQCTHIKDNGDRCGAPCMKGYDHCKFHTPTKLERKQRQHERHVEFEKLQRNEYCLATQLEEIREHVLLLKKQIKELGGTPVEEPKLSSHI